MVISVSFTNIETGLYVLISLNAVHFKISNTPRICPEYSKQGVGRKAGSSSTQCKFFLQLLILDSELELTIEIRPREFDDYIEMWMISRQVI